MTEKKKKYAEITELIMGMKNEILLQMKKGNDALEKKIADSNTKLEKNIKEDLNNIKNDVKQNAEKIEEMNNRLEELEKKDVEKKEKTEPRLLSEILKQPGFSIPAKKIEKEHYVEKAKKIVGLFPVRESDIQHFIDQGCNKEDAIFEAALEFLNAELKMSQQEIESLNIQRVTRPTREGTERI